MKKLVGPWREVVVSWQWLEAGGDAKHKDLYAARYMASSREALGNLRTYFMATDKGHVATLPLQNTCIGSAKNVVVIACPNVAYYISRGSCLVGLCLTLLRGGPSEILCSIQGVCTARCINIGVHGCCFFMHRSVVYAP